jgi:ferredoxin
MVLFKFQVDETKCMNCGACMDLCPPTCVEFTRPYDMSFYGSVFHGSGDLDDDVSRCWMMEKPFVPMQERCTGCGVCVRECPTNAIIVEADNEKPQSARPKPVILASPTSMGEKDDGLWHPLSQYTTDYLKRPVRSPWSKVADWKPTIKPRGASETWRTMGKESQQ